MAKPRSDKTGPIAKKVLARLRAAVQARVVDLRAYAEGTAHAASLRETVVKTDELEGFDPAHAVYVRVQNELSVFAEQLTSLPETAKIADLLEHAQDEYMPEGPPMSPLTRSYFTCWAFFDAADRGETIGTLVLAIGELMKMNAGFLAVVGAMQRSRMGVYVHEGFDVHGRTVLRDLATTSTRCPSVVPSGWRGAAGELWLARVLPPLPLAAAATLDYSVVFTTPYVLRDRDEADWSAYLDRALTSARGDAVKRAGVLKHGIDWSEYIFAAYVGNVAEAIFLTGLPDEPASLPHAR